MRRRCIAGLSVVLSAAVVAGCGSDGPTRPFPVPPAPPVPTSLRVATQPGDARVGAALGIQPVVEVLDARGRPVGDSIPVTASPWVGAGELTGTRTVYTVDGVARFTDLRYTGLYRSLIIRFTAPDLPAVQSALFPLLPPARSTADRPDDFTGPQVHVVYVLPFAGADRRLDTNVDIAHSVGAFQEWLYRATGRRLRVDLFDGVLDVTFFQLDTTAATVTAIERELAAAGRIKPEKRYLIYFDGGVSGPCGGAAWPPLLSGQSAALYLRACNAGPLAAQLGASPGYWEFAGLHDVLHTLGIVPSDAPNHTDATPAHVPESYDLMYGGGTAGWGSGGTMTVDVDRDDYWATIATSPFLVGTPTPVASRLSARLDTATARFAPHQPLVPR